MPRTTKTPETIDPATPEIKMGNRPDGSPWTMHVDFGYGITVSAFWGLCYDTRRAQMSPDEARASAAALLAAAEWVDTGQSQKLEAQATEV